MAITIGHFKEFIVKYQKQFCVKKKFIVNRHNLLGVRSIEKLQHMSGILPMLCSLSLLNGGKIGWTAYEPGSTGPACLDWVWGLGFKLRLGLDLKCPPFNFWERLEVSDRSPMSGPVSPTKMGPKLCTCS